MSEKNKKTLADYRADARKAKQNKNKSVRDRLLKAKFSSTNIFLWLYHNFSVVPPELDKPSSVPLSPSTSTVC